MSDMDTITIPKKTRRNEDDVVVIPRKTYEEFLDSRKTVQSPEPPKKIVMCYRENEFINKFSYQLYYNKNRLAASQ